jgi:hypothetical protein
MARLHVHDPGPGRSAERALADAGSAVIRAAATEGVDVVVQRLLTDGVAAAAACALVGLVAWLLRSLRALPRRLSTLWAPTAGPAVSSRPLDTIGNRPVRISEQSARRVTKKSNPTIKACCPS